MRRRAGLIFAGAVIGCAAGALAPVVLVAACVWDGRTEWSALTEPDTVPYLAVLAGLGLVNGGVGAWDGWRSGRCRMWPVAWAPALLFLFPVAALMQSPPDSKAWGAVFLAVAIIAPFIWVAGRVGQEIGVRGHKRTPEQPQPQPQPQPAARV